MRESMPSSRVREIPIFREVDQRQPHQTYGRTASPANCPPAREIPIQRDTGFGGRPFDDFFHRQDRDWGDPWPNHRGSTRNSDMFNNDPFSRSTGFRSRAGVSGFPSHVGSDFMGDRRSPVQNMFSKQQSDSSSPHRVDSPVTVSQPPQQPVATDTMSFPLPDQPKHTVTMYVEPAMSDTAPPSSLPDQPKQTVPAVVEPAVSDVAPLADETDAKNDATDGSLRVEEPPQRARSPSPAPPNMTPLEVIEHVLAEAFRLKEEVEVYTGGRKEKPYLRLEELLTRLMLKLDRVESGGRDDIRNARREAVRTIQSILDLLESRTSETTAKDQSSAESSAMPENSSSDTTTASDSTSEANMETSCTNDTPRDTEQTKNNVDTAAVKEMVLGSEVPC